MKALSDDLKRCHLPIDETMKKFMTALSMEERLPFAGGQMFPAWNGVADSMLLQPGEQAGIMVSRAAGFSFYPTKWRRNPGIGRGIFQHQRAAMEAQMLAHRKDYTECEDR